MRILEMKVLGDSGKTYTISAAGDGSLHCTCPAFEHGLGLTCKHIDYARQQLRLLTSV